MGDLSNRFHTIGDSFQMDLQAGNTNFYANHLISLGSTGGATSIQIDAPVQHVTIGGSGVFWEDVDTANKSFKIIGSTNATFFEVNDNTNPFLQFISGGQAVFRATPDKVFVGDNADFGTSFIYDRIGNQLLARTDNQFNVNNGNDTSYFRVDNSTAHYGFLGDFDGTSITGGTFAKIRWANDGTGQGAKSIELHGGLVTSSIDQVNFGTTTTLDIHQYAIDVSSSTGATTINLPADASIGQIYIVKDYDVIGGLASGNEITLDAGSGNTIRSNVSAQTYTIPLAGGSVTVRHDGGSTWVVIATS